MDRSGWSEGRVRSPVVIRVEHLGRSRFVDVLLINPPWLTKDGNIRHGVKSTAPPLGLLYVAAFAESKGKSVHVMDVNAEQLHFEDLWVNF